MADPISKGSLASHIVLWIFVIGIGIWLVYSATHTTTEKAAEWCLAYGRDRGEKETAKRTYATEDELMAEAGKGWAAYIYLFAEGRWLYRKMGEGNVWRTDL